MNNKFYIIFIFLFPIIVSCEPLILPSACDDMVEAQYYSPNLIDYRFSSIGSGQGMQVIGDFIYLYGDSGMGIVQELDMDFNSTGWLGELMFEGSNLIIHPTGVAYLSGYPTFIAMAGSIFLIDWDLFYEDQNLDRALLNTISTNGQEARPEYVFYEGQWYVASAKYDAAGNGNEMILMNPEALEEAETVDDPGVIVYRFSIPSYVQDIYWSNDSKRIILVQNIEVYEGWRLTSIDLSKAISLDTGLDEAIVETRCFFSLSKINLSETEWEIYKDVGVDPYKSELEGYALLPDGQEIFLTADPYPHDNLFIIDSFNWKALL